MVARALGLRRETVSRWLSDREFRDDYCRMSARERSRTVGDPVATLIERLKERDKARKEAISHEASTIRQLLTDDRWEAAIRLAVLGRKVIE
jgi:hypothetical protein